MRLKKALILPLAGSLLVLLIAACGSDDPTQIPTAGSEGAATTVQPTPTARSSSFGTPTPTAVPVAVRQTSLEFALGQGDVTQSIDRFHSDFDVWREGLGSCDVSAVQVALLDFEGRFGGIVQSARELSRTAVVRTLSDRLIEAAELEDGALRFLRETWRPESGFEEGDGSSASFEAVASARQLSAVLLKEVADVLADREARTSADSVSQLDEFISAFQEISDSWDQFHESYDSYRTGQGQLSPEASSAGLGELVDQFRGIALAIRDLPQGEVSRRVAQSLADTAEQEDLALRKLRTDTENANNGVLNAFGEPVDSSAAAEAFDAQLVSSNTARLEARRVLEDISADVSSETQKAVAGFSGQHSLLISQWNQFHQDYDQWRRTEGGCNRAEVVEALGEFSVRYGKLSAEARALPSATFLRPMTELMVEAASREESALRDLRNSWRPFDAGVFETLDQARAESDRLRRQVAVGIQELLERYGVSALES